MSGLLILVWRHRMETRGRRSIAPTKWSNGKMPNPSRYLRLPLNAVFCRPCRATIRATPGPNQESTMAELSSGTPPSVRPPEDRLDSWKEIEAYLSRDLTTVQRWEKREGMPVHRHLHDKMGSVYASRAELDAWARSRNREAQESGNDAPSPNPSAPPRCLAILTSLTRWTFVLPWAAVGAALAISASLWLQRTEHFWRNPIADARF